MLVRMRADTLYGGQQDLLRFIEGADGRPCAVFIHVGLYTAVPVLSFSAGRLSKSISVERSARGSTSYVIYMAADLALNVLLLLLSRGKLDKMRRQMIFLESPCPRGWHVHSHSAFLCL